LNPPAAPLSLRLVRGLRRLLAPLFGRDADDRDLIARVFVGMSVGHCVVDSGGRIVMMNEAFRSLIGEEPTDPVASLSARFVGETGDQGEIARLRDRAAAGSKGRIDARRVGADGNVEWRRIEARSIDGRPGAVHWRLEDVTSRREMEEVMLRETRKLADFLDQAPIGFCAVDREGQFVYVNVAFARILGGEPGDLMNSDRRLRDLIDTPPDAGEPWDVVEGGGVEQTVELTMVGLDGRQVPVHIQQVLVLDEAGEVSQTRTVVRDLTSERAWSDALRRSELRFRRFFENAPIGIGLVDSQGRPTECNRAFAQLFGGDVIGAHLIDRADPAGRADMIRGLTEARGSDDPADPFTVRVPGAPERELRIYARRSRELGLVLHVVDLTELRDLEARFVQSQKMQAVGQLAGGVAHDFNNLLTAMIGFCDLLLLRHKPGDQSFGDIMQVKQNANRAANLVRQLLAFSRRQTFQAKVINIVDVLADLSALLRRLIGENIEYRLMHGRDLWPIKVDQNQFEQVVVNLVVNARDAMGGEGRLTIVTSNQTVSEARRFGHDEILPGDYVSVEVIDTGHGIADENLQRIFEPFYSTKAVGSGTGLGLSTVYGIVRQTGGFVEVDSEPGEGARFTILLPRHTGDARDEGADEPRERVGADLTGSATILLVEDEDAVRVFSTRALRNKGYQVMEAVNGEAALILLRRDPAVVDLMITDVVMPKMDGPTLAREARGIRPDLPVIFISGYAEDRFKEEMDNTHFLPKPFSLKQLAAKVREVTRGGRG